MCVRKYRVRHHYLFGNKLSVSFLKEYLSSTSDVDCTHAYYEPKRKNPFRIGKFYLLKCYTLFKQKSKLWFIFFAFI